MKSLLFTSLVLGFVFLPFVNGQAPLLPAPDAAEVAQLVKEREAKRYAVALETFAGSVEGDWAVSLLSEGGVFGSLTVFSLNSKGKLFCGADENGQPIVEDAPQRLTSLAKEVVEGRQMFASDDPKKASKEMIRYCSDCSSESFLIQYRVGAAWEMMMLPLSKSDPLLERFYAAIPADGCRNR